MTPAVLARAYVRDYARNPVNPLLLVAAPLVFVTLSAGALADFADLLGGTGERVAIEANSAGWAAAFLAGVAGLFQVLGAREADRRLSLAGAGPGRVVVARMAAALALALVATAGALLALAARAGIADAPRAIPATAMFAVIYVAIGALVGAVVRSDLNGAVVLLLVWILDVFLGPTMVAGDAALTRAFPTHFPSLVVVDAASGHAGPVSDLVASLAWTVAAPAVAATALWLGLRPAPARRGATAIPAARRPGPAPPPPRGSPPSRAVPARRLLAGIDCGLRQYRRNRPLWALLTAVPAIFILLAVAVTPDDAIAVALTEGGRSALATVPMPDLHVATMGTLAIAALSGLAGVFVACDAGEADRRLAVAGFRSGELLLARGVVVATAALLVTAVSLGVTALVLRPERWGAYVAANLLIAAAYAALGVLLGPPAGRIGGLYLVFLIPFVDLGIGQSPMLRPEPPGWAELLPGYGASRLLVDAAFTAEFSEPRGVVIALAWVAALAGLAAAVLRRATSP